MLMFANSEKHIEDKQLELSVGQTVMTFQSPSKKSYDQLFEFDGQIKVSACYATANYLLEVTPSVSGLITDKTHTEKLCRILFL